MDEMRQQQIEALQTGAEYIEKLIPAMKEIIPELRGEEFPDTKDYLNQQMEALNFVIDIMNGTLSLINETEEVIRKDGVEEKIQSLNKALGLQDSAHIADVLETDILPLLDIFRQISLLVVQKQSAE